MKSYVVSCIESRRSDLMPILDGMPLTFVCESMSGGFLTVEIVADVDVANCIWEAGFHVSEK